MRASLWVLILLTVVTISSARADTLYVGSQASGCCFNVDLNQVDPTGVEVTVTLTDGAQYFVDTGSGQHPGFAFNIVGDPTVTISNLSAPWVASDVHMAAVTTGGPGMGTFDYYIDNPGHGASAHNAAPLTFYVTSSSGVSINDFVANAAGYLFVADIMDGTGNTGLSGIGAVPEPGPAVLLFGLLGLGFAGFQRNRREAQ